jgi:ABC-type Fe3+/spermidine/putrescine transport system ATPase subunit
MIESVSKNYFTPALTDINLEVAAGHILCLLGPSGCGKTTLLRIIAGLETPDHGRIVFDGADQKSIPPHRRQFGMMFQEFALFPHKTVYENVIFGLQMQKKPTADIRRITSKVLELVGMANMAHRPVGDLSGGEKQRVALARSLCPQPRLIMLDEPLGSLDRTMREHLSVEIRRILKELNLTAVFVTHDQTEAFTVADLVAVIQDGRLKQHDTPENLYKQPLSAEVARFLGFHNILPGHAVGQQVETDLGPLECSTLLETGKKVNLVIRPEAARLAEAGNLHPGESFLNVRVKDWLFTGPTFRLTVMSQSGRNLVFDVPNDLRPPETGQQIGLAVRASGLIVLPPDK